MVAKSSMLRKDYTGPIPVRCVQYGRWNPYHDTKFSYGGSSPPTTAASAANQRAVWDSVHTILDATRTITSSQDLHKAYETRKSRLNEASRQFHLVPEQIGQVAIYGNSGRRMFAAEVFAHPSVFSKYQEPLMTGILLEAMQREEETASVPGEASEFFFSPKKAEFTPGPPVSLGQNFRFRGRDGIEGYLLLYEETPVHLAFSLQKAGRP